MEIAKNAILSGKAILGIEFGSTRIKAVLVDETHQPIAMGVHDWENRFEDEIWTYSMNDITTGLQDCYASLVKDVKEKYGVALTKLGAIGFSGMMHGYMPFDKDGNLLVPFRTWRNTMTGQAVKELSPLFAFNVPQRWSIAHLYQAILNQEKHVKDIAFFTTLAGFIHWKLTGQKVMGIGEASGMFPIDSNVYDYNEAFVQKFDALTAKEGFPWKLRDILPVVKCAGENAGQLTPEGAAFLDPEGDLEPGIPLCPCEGDAGTGMAATNSVRVYTGNVSAGTSDFAMIVTDHELGVHREIDMVTTPSGAPVALVHCNNCTTDINAWVALFGEFAECIGKPMDKGELFTLLFKKALEGAPDAGGLLNYNYYSGEGVTDLNEGRPVFLRTPEAAFTLADLMRSHMMSALATLKIGLDILIGEEKVRVDKLYGHGGFFKTPGVGQRFMSAAAQAPVTCMETAGEGGPYGMALLAAYLVWKEEGETLEDFLDVRVFNDAPASTLMADESDINGFNAYVAQYKKSLIVEEKAIETL